MKLLEDRDAFLKGFTEAELKKELQRRVDEELAREETERAMQNNWVVANAEVLMDFVKHHSVRQCSDMDYQRNTRCPRCILWHIKHDQYMDPDHKLTIELYKDPITPKALR